MLRPQRIEQRKPKPLLDPVLHHVDLIGHGAFGTPLVRDRQIERRVDRLRLVIEDVPDGRHRTEVRFDLVDAALVIRRQELAVESLLRDVGAGLPFPLDLGPITLIPVKEDRRAGRSLDRNILVLAELLDAQGLDQRMNVIRFPRPLPTTIARHFALERERVVRSYRTEHPVDVFLGVETFVDLLGLLRGGYAVRVGHLTF